MKPCGLLTSVPKRKRQGIRLLDGIFCCSFYSKKSKFCQLLLNFQHPRLRMFYSALWVSTVLRRSLSHKIKHQKQVNKNTYGQGCIKMLWSQEISLGGLVFSQSKIIPHVMAVSFHGFSYLQLRWPKQTNQEKEKRKERKEGKKTQ